MSNRETQYALPWLDEEMELFRKLRIELGDDPKAIKQAMDEEGWVRSLRAIIAKMRYKPEPEKKPVGPQDPVQIIAICKPWRTDNDVKRSTTKPNRRIVRNTAERYPKD
jgi:hypothetical protein